MLDLFCSKLRQFMETLLKHFGIFGAGLLVWSGFITLTWKADEAIASEPRRQLACMLQGIEVRENIDGWPEFFARMFDRAFGKNYLSLRFVSLSVAASYISALVISLVWWTMYMPDPMFWGDWEWMPGPFIAIGIAGIFNVLPDYVSILETRFLLRVVGGRAARIAAILIVDAIATCLIFWAWFVVITAILGWHTGFVESNPYGVMGSGWSLMVREFWPAFTFSGETGGVASIFFYSTFFTSVWLWLYALAYGAMLLARKIGPVIRFLQWLLPLDARPLRSLGLVSGAIGCIGFWIFGFLATHAA